MTLKQWFKKFTSALLVFSLLVALFPASAFAEDEANFINGPYLLAPKTTSMVVVWESTKNVAAELSYGTELDNLSNPVTVLRDESAPDFKGAKVNFYHYKLENLTPGTKYYYKVQLTDGDVCTASFTTLKDDPDKIKILSLSDSHIFATRDEFNEAVSANDPDFIIHCGDLVEGTGFQVEQFGFWFNSKFGDGDFIHNYPVVYSSGNHDQGGDFFSTYVYDIQDEEYGAKVLGNSSFNYGNIHVSLMNSNPWGLYQMNTESTGGTADAKTLKTVADSKAWLAEDLATDDAKNATFRILTMHHPKSDKYTNKHIPAIAEAGNVDLMLSGHTHSYALDVSDNPAVGAGTVYMTHQDARTNNKKGDYYIISITDDLMKVENYGRDGAAPAASKLANTTLIGSEAQKLEYSNVSITPENILCNGEITVTANVKNSGNGIAAAVIPVNDNGKERYIYLFDGSKKIMEPGTNATLTGTIKLNSVGTHEIDVAGVQKTIPVSFRPATFSYENIRTKLGDKSVSDINSNKLNVKADILNIGNEPGVAAAAFKIDGKTVETQKYTLKEGEMKTAEFTYTFHKSGSYQVTIGDAAPQTVYIEGSIQGLPVVKDKSGSGNNGYIHGEPEFGTDDKGHQTLILDGKRDYIEIPDLPDENDQYSNYFVEDAATGMVWANLPSLGTTKGGVSELVEGYADPGVVPDHNPLMMKGVGLGWGTPYLFRIAIRETGKVTYGVCFHDDNGEFSWNDGSQANAGIKKDTWVQYTSAFDFETGGDSYQNEVQSAHVDKPVFGGAPVKNWEGTSMYIGLGFKNTFLKNRNRGMYYTMLPGAISQVRFYTSKVSQQEHNDVRNEPDTAGDSADSLKIWLDFENENIINTGTHTTEWVLASDAPTALSYDAVIKGNAVIKAKIQTSDDKATIRSEKEFKLENGQNTIEISDITKGNYVRIVSTFISDLNTSESSVPVLNEYGLKAGSTKTWNTLVDWNMGTFENAAGHQSGDAYRNHTKDFDDYSGTASEPDSESSNPSKNHGSKNTSALPNEKPSEKPEEKTEGTSGYPYHDVKNHWAKDSIAFVSEKNLFKGTSEDKFSPNNKMTRAMFVTVLGRLAQVDAKASSNSFSDVPDGSYYSQSVSWAVEKGIINGFNGKFNPNAPITREQIIVMIQRYLESSNQTLGSKESNNGVFADQNAISPYAASAVNELYKTGIIAGKENNKLDPQGEATRAEVATIIMRLVEAMEIK